MIMQLKVGEILALQKILNTKFGEKGLSLNMLNDALDIQKHITLTEEDVKVTGFRLERMEADPSKGMWKWGVDEKGKKIEGALEWTKEVDFTRDEITLVKSMCEQMDKEKAFSMEDTADMVIVVKKFLTADLNAQ